MSSLFDVADALDKLASEVDARVDAVPVTPKVASAAALPPYATPAPAPVTQAVKTAMELTRVVTGKTVSPATATKIANDAELREVIEKLAAEKNKPTPMGGPAEEKTAAGGTDDRKERYASAFDNWGSAVTRNG